MNAYPLVDVSRIVFPRPVFALLGALALALAPQDVRLTDPQASAQSTRTPAIDTSVQVYDVKDLVEKLAIPAGMASDTDASRADLERKLTRYLANNEKAQRAGAGEGEKKNTRPGPVGGDEQASAVSQANATRDLAQIVQRHMKPAFEPDKEQLTTASAGLIVGNLRAEQHAWLRAFLDLQKRTSGVVEIGVTIFDGPRGCFRDAGLKDASTVFEDPAVLSALCARLQKKDHVNTVTSPRLALLNGQKASISVLDQVAYVKDWKLTIVEPGPQEIADPTVDIVQDGIVGEFRATALETDVYAVDVSFIVAKLERPMATRKIRISATNDKEVEIGVPVVMKVNFESNLVLTDGAAAVFTTASPERDKDLAIVLTLKHRALEVEAK